MSSTRSALNWLLAALLALSVAGLVAVWWTTRPRPQPDMVAVLDANNQGVGLMERFDYDQAVEAFAKVVKLAPDWLPGQINLGIALLNTAKKSELERAIGIFNKVLDREPENPYAHFCLGIIYEHQGNLKAAHPQFEAVTRIDPHDAHGWYYRGYTLDGDDKAQKEFYEKALACNPYLRRAIFGMAGILRREGDPKAAELEKRFEGLNQRFDAEKRRYGEMGHYAEVIGRVEKLHGQQAFGPLPLFTRNDKLNVKLRPGTRWATAADFGSGATGDLRRAIRKRFGATMVVLDYNRDGKPDFFLLAAVVESGKVRDLLLRNDGNYTFTDVTHEAGLAEPRPSLGCTVADFDNDGYSDLFITGAGRQWLFRNTGKTDPKTHRFEEVTGKAGLDKLTSVCLGACFLDLDHDGDLDLVVAQYAATVDDALSRLAKGKEPGAKTKGGLAAYLNVGEAKSAVPRDDPPPLEAAFKRIDKASWLDQAEPAVALAASDLDKDGDLDLVALSDGHASAIINDRLLHLRRLALPPSLVEPRSWNGALILDVNHDERSDLFVISPDARPVLLISKSVPPEQKDLEKWFDKGDTNSPPLVQAQAIDLDYDGWTDVVGLSAGRMPVLLHNEGGKLVHILEGLGSDKDWPKDLVALAVVNLEGKYADLVAWSEAGGLQVYRNEGNQNQALKLELSGHRRVEPTGTTVRCNADGFGVRVAAQAGAFWTGAEYTTLSAGLGQSRQPLILGLGQRPEADVVRLRWPDNCWQAELNKPACRLVRIEEANRKGDSCPLLFTWDGTRFTFVADFLGGGAMGEVLPDGTCRQPRPQESIKIEAGQLVPKDGYYVLKVAEPMDEVIYLDRLRLEVVDHPAQVRVYADERFVLAGPQPTQQLLAFQADQEVFPIKARDHKGRDVTELLRRWDRDTVADFGRRTWTGIAEDHWIEMDYGDRLARFQGDQRLALCVVGWTDYPYPESIWAATQAGVALQAPVLERLGPDGTWQTLVPEAGFPAGLTRMTTLELTGKLSGPRCVLRLRSNMNVYWDQVFVAPLLSGQKQKTTTVLDVHTAELVERGCMQEFSPDGKQPTLYDYHRLERVPVTRHAGLLTRLGDVTTLLQKRDDLFTIFGPGDEITVKFDARKLPRLPAGWTRSFVLRCHGYSKSAGPFILTGDTVEPLPFEKMSRFPYGGDEHYPETPEHAEYRRRFNTRPTGMSRR